MVEKNNLKREVKHFQNPFRFVKIIVHWNFVRFFDATVIVINVPHIYGRQMR